MNGLQRKCLFAMLVMGAILIYRIVFMYYYTMRCHICIALLRDHICGRLFLYIQWCCRCCWLNFIILNAHHVNLLHHYRHDWISATTKIISSIWKKRSVCCYCFRPYMEFRISSSKLFVVLDTSPSLHHSRKSNVCEHKHISIHPNTRHTIMEKTKHKKTYIA